jgi:hypothetical protein
MCGGKKDADAEPEHNCREGSDSSRQWQPNVRKMGFSSERNRP